MKSPPRRDSGLNKFDRTVRASGWNPWEYAEFPSQPDGFLPSCIERARRGRSSAVNGRFPAAGPGTRVSGAERMAAGRGVAGIAECGKTA